MPQKKNPDSLELIRSKAGRVFGRVRRAWSRAKPLADPGVLGKLPGRALRSRLLTLTLPSVCRAPDDPQGTSEHLQQGLTGVRLRAVGEGPLCIDATYRLAGPWHFQAGAPQNRQVPSRAPRP